MKFLLVSRHTGAEVPEEEREESFKAWTAWVEMLHASSVLPVHGGKTITKNSVEEYQGNVGGVLLFEANSIEEAVEKAKKSPGLRYGWTHDILQEIE